MIKLTKQVKELLPGIDVNTMTSAACLFQKKKVEKGQIIIKEGKISDKLYFIENGYTRTYLFDQEKEITTWFCFEGDFITAFNSFFQKKPSKENVVTMMPCTMFYITNESLDELIKEVPIWDTFTRLFLTHLVIKLKERLDLLQNLSAEKKYQYLFNKYPHIIETVPNKHIASYLGITKETLSRIRAKKIKAFIDICQ